MQHHLASANGCQYKKVQCESCDAHVKRKEILSHAENKCPKRMVSCSFCHQKGTCDEISGVHKDKCSEKLIECKAGCGIRLSRNDMSSHIQHGCRNASFHCPFSIVGCVVSPATSTELEAHTATCTALNLAKVFHQFTTEINELKSSVQVLNTNNLSLQSQVKQAKEEITTASKEMASLERKTESMMKTVLSELEYISSSSDHVNLLAIECIRTNLSSGITHFQTDGPPATLRLKSYKECKECGRAWYSPPFSILDGYTLCLSVHLNGIGAGKNSHISIYLHQFVSERDSDLPWPYLLQDSVIVSLLLQKKQDIMSPSTKVRTLLFTKKETKESDRLKKYQDLSLSAKSSGSIPASSRSSNDHVPSKKNDTQLVIYEQQHIMTNTYLRKIKRDHYVLQIGPVVGKLDLFCTQQRVEQAVWRDSLVFQCSLQKSSVGEMSLLTM